MTCITVHYSRVGLGHTDCNPKLATDLSTRIQIFPNVESKSLQFMPVKLISTYFVPQNIKNAPDDKNKNQYCISK